MSKATFFAILTVVIIFCGMCWFADKNPALVLTAGVRAIAQAIGEAVLALFV